MFSAQLVDCMILDFECDIDADGNVKLIQHPRPLPDLTYRGGNVVLGRSRGMLPWN